MEERLITFITAKLAKEKGFDFDTCKMEVFVCDDDGNYCKDKSIHMGYPHTTYIHRPSQSLLQKWLRDKHKIDVSPNKTIGSEGTWYYFDISYTNSHKKIKNSICEGSFSYEDSLEKGLRQALKLI